MAQREDPASWIGVEPCPSTRLEAPEGRALVAVVPATDPAPRRGAGRAR